MSFKILIFRLTGKLRATEKIEAERRNRDKSYEAFLEAEQSEELKTFRESDSWIKTGEYVRRKKEIEAQVFKGSQEYNLLREFEELGKKGSIKNYFKVLNSNELKKFRSIEGSEELKKYRELKSWIEEGKFYQEKQEILKQKFEGSPEQQKLKELETSGRNKSLRAFLKLNGSESLKNHLLFRESGKLKRYSELKRTAVKDKKLLKELKMLHKDPEIRAYFKFEKSNDFKYYLEMKGSPLPARYEGLLHETRSDPFMQKVAFLKDRKKLEKSEPWKRHAYFKALSKSDNIRFYLKYGNSSLYKSYLDVQDSPQLKRFTELKTLTASPVFLERKAFLEDKRKFEKSAEYARYQEYLLLEKNQKVLTYYKYVDSHDFDFLKQWEVSFADDFDGSALDKGKWIPNTYLADRFLGDNYSQPGDLQAYVGGANCLVQHDKLLILTKKEKTAGKRWQTDFGFVPVEFGYTSDLLSTAKSFWQKEGIFEAKVKFNPVKEVVQSCHLLGESVTPQVTLVEQGPKSRAGLLFFDEARKPQFAGVSLTNLKKDLYYLFRIEWENNHIIWKINDRKIFEREVPALQTLLHINLTCLVINEISSSKLPVSFEIDWIRSYRKK